MDSNPTITKDNTPAPPILYAYGASAPARAIIAFLELVGIKYEKKLVDLIKLEQKAPEYLKLNPNGLVPTLDDNGFIVFESEAIIRYLINSRNIQTSLYPADPKIRSLVDRYIPFHQSEFTPAILNFFTANFRALNPNNKESLETTRDIFEAKMKKFETIHLGDKEYIVGDTLTIADLYAGSQLNLVYYSPVDFDWTKYPRLKDYMDRLDKNPGVHKATEGLLLFREEVLQKLVSGQE